MTTSYSASNVKKYIEWLKKNHPGVTPPKTTSGGIPLVNTLKDDQAFKTKYLLEKIVGENVIEFIEQQNREITIEEYAQVYDSFMKTIMDKMKHDHYEFENAVTSYVNKLKQGKVSKENQISDPEFMKELGIKTATGRYSANAGRTASTRIRNTLGTKRIGLEDMGVKDILYDNQSKESDRSSGVTPWKSESVSGKLSSLITPDVRQTEVGQRDAPTLDKSRFKEDNEYRVRAIQHEKDLQKLRLEGLKLSKEDLKFLKEIGKIRQKEADKERDWTKDMSKKEQVGIKIATAIGSAAVGGIKMLHGSITRKKVKSAEIEEQTEDQPETKQAAVGESETKPDITNVLSATEKRDTSKIVAPKAQVTPESENAPSSETDVLNADEHSKVEPVEKSDVATISESKVESPKKEIKQWQHPRENGKFRKLTDEEKIEKEEWIKSQSEVKSKDSAIIEPIAKEKSSLEASPIEKGNSEDAITAEADASDEIQKDNDRQDKILEVLEKIEENTKESPGSILGSGGPSIDVDMPGRRGTPGAPGGATKAEPKPKSKAGRIGGLAKGAGKMALKSLPFIGTAMALGGMAYYAMQGDTKRTAAEAAGLIPFAGGAASMAAHEVIDSQEESDELSKVEAVSPKQISEVETVPKKSSDKLSESEEKLNVAVKQQEIKRQQENKTSNAPVIVTNNSTNVLGGSNQNSGRRNSPRNPDHSYNRWLDTRAKFV